MMPRRAYRAAWLTLPVVLAGGCAAGPDFKRPAPPEARSYMTEQASTSVRFDAAQDIPAEWWKVFRSEQLDTLVKAALANNPDIQSARATLRAAAENYRAQRGALFPSVEADVIPSRQRTATASVTSNAATGASIYSLYTVQAGAAYTLDIFGGVRRLVESARAQMEYERCELQAAYLTIASNLVGAVIQSASLTAQETAAEHQVAQQEELLGIARRQLELGDIAQNTVFQYEAALSQDRIALAALRKQVAAEQDLVAVLAGRFPADQPAPRIALADLHLPDTLPVMLPAALVDRRPDVRAAEAQWHAAAAQVGVATAARLPAVTLSADSGSAALAVGRLFGPGTAFWNLSAGLATPLFQGGQLMHKQRAAEALYDQAAAQYRGSVISAVQSVADALQAIQADDAAYHAAEIGEQASRRLMDTGLRQAELGDISHVATIPLQQAHEQSSIALIQAEAARYADAVALFQALGGGSWDPQDGGMPFEKTP